MNKEDRLAWFREARFGLFIHWGVYSSLSEIEWNGRKIHAAEWVMHHGKIPAREYEKLAGSFNPVQFNAKEWVSIAKDAGMKYIVITAKHCEGFAMYNSMASTYNIVDMTSFKRDPIRELAEECQKQGIRLGFYYAQVLDWHDPDGCLDEFQNDWDYKKENKDFNLFWRKKVLPQVTELLTGYGSVGILWFDTPSTLNREKSEELLALVRRLQPECLVNSRISHHKVDYDYISLTDQEIPPKNVGTDWETPCTLNDSYGFEVSDHHWKEPSVLVRNLIDVASKGGNYLLNVGPKGNGSFPAEAVERLKSIGKWMQIHGETIYGTTGNPYPYELEWGTITVKPGKMYLHVFHPPENVLVLKGLANPVTKACFHTGKTESVTILLFNQTIHTERDLCSLEIQLPTGLDSSFATIIALDIEGEPAVDSTLTQQQSGRIELDLSNAVFGEDSGLVPEKTATWNFKIHQPGAYEIRVHTYKRGGIHNWEFKGDIFSWEKHRREVRVKLAGQGISSTQIQMDQPEITEVIQDSRKIPYGCVEINSLIGVVNLPKVGLYTLKLQTAMIILKEDHSWNHQPVKVSAVVLVPAAFDFDAEIPNE